MKTLDQLPESLTATCEIHGEYEALVSRIPILNKYMISERCPQCLAVPDEAAQEAHKEEVRASEAKAWEARKKQAGINLRHLECTLESYRADTPEKQNALGKAREFVSNILSGNGGNLILAGKVGTGKTHLAAAITSEVLRANRSCRLAKLPEIIRDIKNSWRGEGPSESELIDRYSKVDLLIIDEVGVQYGSDTEKLLISEIIDNRYQEMLPTVLISNLDVQGIKGCIGERCYDRLREDGGIVANFTWESHRGEA